MRIGMVAIGILLVQGVAWAAVKPVDLRCERRVNPLGVDAAKPVLSWVVRADPVEMRGQRQSAYEVRVASSKAALASGGAGVWDSGKVASSDSVDVAYAGPGLGARRAYWWTVRLWDGEGKASAWSEPATWATGMMAAGSEWGAQWIGAVAREVVDESAGHGYLSEPGKKIDDAKWVQVDLGEPTAIDRIVLHPAIPQMHQDWYGSPGDYRMDVFPAAFRVDVSDDPAFGKFTTVFESQVGPWGVYFKPRHACERIDAGGVKGRYVRVTAVRLWNDARPGDKKPRFGLSELQVFRGEKNVALHRPVTAEDSVEADGWGAAQLTDGKGLIDPVADAVADDAVMLRKEVTLKATPVRATAYVCGLGYHELSINGRKVGDRVLSPLFTDFTKRVGYLTSDVTGDLKAGPNAVGILLGNGWYRTATPDYFGFQRAAWRGPLKAMLVIEAQFADGSTQRIVTDGSWKWSTGEIRYNCIRGGETDDARLATPGWDRPGYDDRSWRGAVILPAPAGRVVSQIGPAIRVRRIVPAVKLTNPMPGVWVYDLGENISGWPRFAVSGRAGQRVTLDCNEVLRRDGTVDLGHVARYAYGRFQRDVLICSGRGRDVLEPRFTYHGFRYVQVTGLSSPPALGDLQGCLVCSDVKPAGEFLCSNPLLGQILSLYRRTQLNNLEGNPTDCPTREKMGWMEDGSITEGSTIFNYNMQRFYEQWLTSMMDQQDASGHMSSIVPTAGWGRSGTRARGAFSAPWWGGAVVRTPWKLYVCYGDRAALAQAYPHMKAYVDYLSSTARDNIVSWGLGDWLDESADVGMERDRRHRKAPVPQTSTAAYYRYAQIVGQAAGVLGHAADAARYAKLAEEIAASFNKAFLESGSAVYAPDSQTAQAVPLVFGIVPAEVRERAGAALVKDIVEVRRNHINSGIVGTPFVYRQLHAMGRDDVAYAMMSSRSYPSLGYMVEQGATTIWESWSKPGGLSHNHPTLGSCTEWLYAGLGGIEPDASAPGFAHVVIRPGVVKPLSWVRCRYDSVRGPIRSDWKLDGAALTLEVSIPANVRATVYVPAQDPAAVREGDRPAGESPGVKAAGVRGGAAVFEVGGGHYVFHSTVKS